MLWKAESFLCGGGLILAACGVAEGDSTAPLRLASAAPAQVIAPATAPVAPAEPLVPVEPSKPAGYDEVGYASWYGHELGGNKTANGEIFRPAGISAAHRTLPLNSYAEVTALTNGRTILVRINDRGPFHGNRIIDLSMGAAKQLGIKGGHFPVRVRRVDPPEQEKSALKRGERAAERIATPPILLTALRKKLNLKPVEVAAATSTTAKTGPSPPRPTSVENSNPMPPADAGRDFVIEQAGASPDPPAKPAADTAGGWFVQVATFSSAPRASALAKRIGGQSIASGAYWRVRKGPFASEMAARRELAEIMTQGYHDARVTR